jgi:hypothetical protein
MPSLIDWAVHDYYGRVVAICALAIFLPPLRG